MPTQPDAQPFSHRPLWYQEAPLRQPLEGAHDADVVIVGAGFTGLWTAYYLLKAQPSLRVLIIDRERVGYGASGRNGGWVSGIFPISLSRVAQLYSHQAALHLQAAMNDTVDEIGRVLQQEGIHADYAKEGFLSLARTQAQARRIHATVDASTQFGLPHQWQALNAIEASEKMAVASTLGALYTPHCAVIHPGKLVHGLALLVERMGAHIYEQTSALNIAPGHVRTEQGTINATTIVRATEAFSCQQAEYRRSVIPLYSLVLATEPLPEALLQTLKLNHRLAFNDMRHLRVYGQVTSEGRIVFGGRGAPYHFGSRMSEKNDVVDSVHHKIHTALLSFFPELKAAAITHRWGGALGVSRDWCPTVSMDQKSRIAWAGNYVGDGVATSNLAGRILRNLILNHDEALNTLPLVNHQSPVWEPEPIRWLGINAGLLAAGLSDVEERITHQPSRTAKLLDKLTGAH